MLSRALSQMRPATLLENAALQYSSREALYCAGSNRRCSFPELEAGANRLVNGLLGLGRETW